MAIENKFEKCYWTDCKKIEKDSIMYNKCKRCDGYDTGCYFYTEYWKSRPSIERLNVQKR